jgi:hypothetical protein
VCSSFRASAALLAVPQRTCRMVKVTLVFGTQFYDLEVDPADGRCPAAPRRNVPLRVLYVTCLEVTACRAGAEILKIQVTSLTDIPPDKLLISGIGEGRAPLRLPYALQLCLIRARHSDCTLPVAAAGYLHDLADISSLKDGQLLTVTAGLLAGAMHAHLPPRSVEGSTLLRFPEAARGWQVEHGCDRCCAWWQVMPRQSRIRTRGRSRRAPQRFPTTPARRSMTSSLQTRCCWDRTVEQPPRAR